MILRASVPVFALSSCLVVLAPTSLLAGSSTPPIDTLTSATAKLDPTLSKGTISASGEALVRVAPDRIVLQFGLQRTGPRVPELTAQMAADGKRFIQAITKTGVSPQQIQTDVLSLEMEYHEGSRPSSGVKAYTVSRSYSIRLTTTTLVEAVMEAAFTEGGAVTMDGPMYGVENPRPLRDQARQLAIQAAREKAELLAAGLGRKVGRATSVGEGWNNLIGGFRPSYGRGWSYAQNSMQNVVQNMGGSQANGGDEGLPFGQVGVGASVTVTFEME